MSRQFLRFEYNPGAGDVARSPVVYGVLAGGRGLEELVRTFSLISVSPFAPQSRAFVWSLIHVLVAPSLRPRPHLTVLHYFSERARLRLICYVYEIYDQFPVVFPYTTESVGARDNLWAKQLDSSKLWTVDDIRGRQNNFQEE